MNFAKPSILFAYPKFLFAPSPTKMLNWSKQKYWLCENYAHDVDICLQGKQNVRN